MTTITIEPYPNNTVDWLTRLIAFDTVSKTSNLMLIKDIQSFCESLGLQTGQHIHPTFNEQANKANLFVTIPAGVNADIFTGGIVLSGHTDVVPVEGQDWSSNPFEAIIKEGKLFGRGACDMKGFLACCLTMLPAAFSLSKAGKLTKPVHLAFSYDEEIGCLGAPVLLEDVKKRQVNPEYCIVGEPSDMKMVIAHKGINVFRCRVHGKSVHSSLTPSGVNAISYASQLINFIDDLGIQLTKRQDNDELYDVPYSTISVGMINGGTASNIVPNLCEFVFDYRNLPFMGTKDILEPIQTKISELTQHMQQIDSNTKIELQQLEQVPALTDTDSEQLQSMIKQLNASNQPTDEINKVAYATEAGQFAEAGIPTIICGPGSIKQAHRPDEFVSLEQLDKCDEFLQKILTSLQN